MPGDPSTVDTNIAIYSLLQDPKASVAAAVLAGSAFLSVQVLNEYANVARRKLRRSWPDIAEDIVKLRRTVPTVLRIRSSDNTEALRIAARYQLPFYDALMLAVALSGGARAFYSEDMQHDMIVDDALRVVNPFRPDAQ